MLCLAGVAAGVAVPAGAFDLPNSADAPCRTEGTTLSFLLDAAPDTGAIQFPRLNNVVLEASWAPRLAADAQAANPPSEHAYLAPSLPSPELLLRLTQTPDTWTLTLPEGVTYPATITLRLDSPPLHAPAGHLCRADEDGTITLPARHAMVTGEKLQFEPLPHKRTVGYWVNADDVAEWAFATDAAGSWDLHVLQGCGGGQGGSRVAFGVGEQTVEHVVVDTGHFQNFRWHKVGTLELPAAERHILRVGCVEKAHNAVMDIRQIRLVPSESGAAGPRTISQTAPDVLLPPLATTPPAAGRRVLMRLPDREDAACYHTLSLPTDWQAKRTWPVLIEWAGNGPFAGRYGDTNSGRVEDACLAQGLAGTDGAIVLGLPYLDGTGSHNVSMWWGTPPTYDHAATIAYAKAAIRDVCERFAGDPERVVLVGFSRGSIACNALGLADDEMASLWQAAVCFSHYDGLRTWPFPHSDAASAKARLARLGDRRQLILAESTEAATDESLPPALAATQRYLAELSPQGGFEFLETGFLNHDDDWALRPSPARQQARQWLTDVLSLPDRRESL